MNRVFFSIIPLLFSIQTAFATNGMDMESYGPIAQGSGGASIAAENGTAAMMNNPATLSMMNEGVTAEFAVGFLGPDVQTQGQNGSSTSMMPAFGIVKKQDKLTFGMGIFAQGGMGTEYTSNAFSAPLVSMGGAPVSDPHLTNRSEVGVGRVLFPLSYQATPRLAIGGSVDYVWASMDLQMLMSGAQFRDYVPAMGGSGKNGTISGSMLAAIQGIGGDVNWGYFNFSDNKSYSGAAKASGWAGKVGFTYQVDPQLTVGAVYHTKTYLSDLTTDQANVQFSVTGVGVVKVPGRITVHNFQMPSILGIGVKYAWDDRLTLLSDYKRIGWKSVMESMKMTFSSSMGNLDVTMKQNWTDQDVLMLGFSYKPNDRWTLRGGLNLANNPVPEDLTNPLFPAIVKNHLTAGFGYAFDKKMAFQAGLTYAPKVNVTNNLGQSISHSQTNVQLLLSKTF